MTEFQCGLRYPLTTMYLLLQKGLAAKQQKSIGEVISSPARQALQPHGPISQTRNCIPLLSVRPGATTVTSELVNELRDQLR